MACKKYAVAFRDGTSLYLYPRITRNLRGEVFVILPTTSSNADDHVSYHADGRIHNKFWKGSEQKFLPRQGPPLDKFTGVFPLLGINISATTKFSVPCDPADFDEVFEIPRGKLTGNAQVSSSNLEVMLVEPGKSPPTYPGNTVLLDRHIFQDAAPWIVVSLFDFAWLRARHGL